MTLSFDWDVERDGDLVLIRVTAELRLRRTGPEVTELSVTDEQGRPMTLTDAEDWEMALRAMAQAAEDREREQDRSERWEECA